METVVVCVIAIVVSRFQFVICQFEIDIDGDRFYTQ